jgi:mycofactocin glycosyltransferase
VRLGFDPSARRLDAGRILLGGSPLRLFRLSAGGAAIVDRIEAGESLRGNHAALTDRLIDAGAVHPLRDIDEVPMFTAADVTLVIPAFARSGAVDDLREALAAIVASTGAASALVIDDASPEPIAMVDGATVLRLERNVGPGGARAAGLDQVTTALVAFVDTDVIVEPGWIDGLLIHFNDSRVGLVAPRVLSAPGSSVLERYETWRSPLDLGDSPARIRAGSRVSYVPGAAIVVRAEALETIGGFNPALRWGEDVDLVWRLDATRWRCRYEPSVTVSHLPKPNWMAWLRQRYSYGSSAAPLAIEHPGALAPARLSGWSAASWVLLVGGRRVAPLGVLTAVGTTLALSRKLAPMEHPVKESFRLAGLGHLFAGRILASAITRAWWPLAVVAAVVSRRFRWIVGAAMVTPPMIDWLKERPALDPARAVALRVLDDAAYGTGLWAGVMRTRSMAALVPDLTSWPGRRPAPSSE